MRPLLAALARAAARRPWATIGAAAALSLASIVPIARVSFDTDLMQLLPRRDPRVRAFAEAKDLVAEPGTLWALFDVEGGGAPDAREALAAYADAWGAALGAARGANERPFVRAVEVRVPERFARFFREVLARRGFLYLEGEDLREALGRLEPAAIRAAVAAAKARFRTAAPVQLSRALAQDPLGLGVLFGRRAGRGLGAMRFDAMSGYVLSSDGRALLAKAIGDRPAGQVAFSRALMDAAARAEAAGAAAAAARLPPGATVRARYAGAYPITLENERSIRRDIWVTFGSSFVTVVGIFVYAFRRGRALAFAAVPLAAGMLWTFAAISAATGRIGVATTAFASVVIGLGVDYAIHIVGRYVGERRAGAEVERAVETALASSGGGVVPAALMTIAAFLAFGLTSFPALAELGVLAAAGMAICLISTFWLLPPLLALLGRRADESRPTSDFFLPKLWSLVERRPHQIFGACALLTGLALWYLLAAPGLPVRLESDIRNLLPRGDRTSEVQDAIGRHFGLSPDLGLVVVEADAEERALHALRDFERAVDPLVASGALAGYESPARYLPPRADQERAREALAKVDPDRVAADLRAALAAEGFKLAAFDDAVARLREQLRPPGLVDRALLEEAGLGELLAGLERKLDGPAVGLMTVFPAPGRDGLRQLEAANASLGSPGTSLAANVVVTGVGTVVRALVAALERDFVLATGAAAAAVLAIALLHFRRVEPALLAALPAFVGFAWMLAVMKLLDLPVNFMNVIVFPMVIGIEDNAVHIVHRVREPGSGGVRRALDEIGLALFLCTATTMLGFGSLVLSENRGLASIGAVTLIGKLTCWVTGTIALPAWLALEERRRATSAPPAGPPPP